MVAVALAAMPFDARAASPIDPLYACAAFAADAERLKCFDDALAKLRAAEQTGDLTVVDRAGVRTLEKDSFGFNLPSFGALFARKTPASTAPTAPILDEVGAKIAQLNRTPGDQAVFALDNGQVWRQIDTTRTATIRSGEDVTIRRAALGSFLLVRASGGAGIRVRRVE